MDMRKRFLVGLFFLAGNLFSQTGSLEVTVWANTAGYGKEKYWSVELYNSSWQKVGYQFQDSSPAPFLKIFSFGDLNVGNYYVFANVWLVPFFQWEYPLFTGDPWRPEYHNNSPSQSGASSVAVTASATTQITMNLEWTTYIVVTTNPMAFQFKVDGGTHSAPKRFSWRQGESHLLEPSEFIDLTDGGRCYFKEWRHGGSRVQNYSVPSPVFGQVKDTLVARYAYKYRLDVQTAYGHPSPKASDWYTAWQNVTFSVEDTVVHYSDGTFAFPKSPAVKDSLLLLFDRWQGTGLGSYSGKNNPATVNLQANTVEKAEWKRKFPLAALSADTTMGKVLVTPAGRWQDEDSLVTVQALPKPGYRFKKWSGASTDTARTVKIKMDTSKTVTAAFEASTGIPEEIIPDPQSNAPADFCLYPNYPNPFNPVTEIRFDVPREERVVIEVFSLIGVRLAVLADTRYGPGQYRIVWDGTGGAGRPLCSGIYLCRMSAGAFTRVSKMHLIK